MHNSKKNLSTWFNTNRIYVCLAAVLILAPIFLLLSEEGAEGAVKFFASGTMVPMIETSILYIMTGIGFTYVMIGGNFDLSVTSMINVGAVLSLGMFNEFYDMFGGSEGGDGALFGGWTLGILVAVLAGCIFGAINGALVSYGGVHSFIVTIGSMTALSGFVYTFSGGNTLSADDRTFSELIGEPFHKMGATEFVEPSYLDVFTIRFVVMVALVAVFAIILLKSRWGRDYLMTGSNKEAAWHAGINTKRKIMTSFIISGFCAALAGVMFAVNMNAAVPNFGERGINPLMLTLAATIIGGTVMTGGSGNVVKTAVAVITIEIIFSLLISLGLGFDAQVLAAGALLAIIVLYEAFSLYRQSLKKGIRPQLLEEAERYKKQFEKQK